MQPAKPSSAGQHQQQQREQSHGRGPGRPQPNSGADKQTRSEIENQPPPPRAWEAEREVAGGTNLSATRAGEGADLPLVAATSRAAPPVEGANCEPSCVVIEFCVQPDDKQSGERIGQQNLKQIHSSRAPGELARVEREPNNARECGDERIGRQTNDDDDPIGQIRFEQQQKQPKRRQAPSDFRDLRLDQQQQGQSSARISVVAAEAEASSSGGSRATGTAVICGLVDGSEQTATGRPPTWRESDRPTGASDELPEVGCHKLQQPPPLAARLFNQNSGTALSEQVDLELTQSNKNTNQSQANQKQQRIKVTLSKPKQELEQEEEARKLGEFYTQTTTTLGDLQQQQVAGSQCSASSSQINFGQVRAPRRSTATLISGSSEPEVDSFESAPGAAADLHPQEKINQIWRNREPVAPQRPPLASLAQDASRQASARAASKDTAAPASGQHELELTRLERENQLRRIASQRRRAPPPPPPLSASASQSASTTEGPPPPPTRSRSVRAARAGGAAAAGAPAEEEKRNFLLATATSRVGQQQISSSKQQGGDSGPTLVHESQTTTTTRIVIPRASVAGHQTTNAPIKQSQTQSAIESGQQRDPSLPSKQLAIYINGKIRSNSIFCSRSVSSNSFTSILKSFQHHSPSPPLSGSGDQQQPASDLEQRLVCKPPNNETQAFLTGSHNKSQAAAASSEEFGEGEDHQHAEGQPANKSFVHCLVSKRTQQTPPGPLETFVGSGHQHERHRENNKRSFLARCRDYISGPSGGASKSTGIYDTQQSHAKGPELTTTTTTTTTTGSQNITTDQADQQPRTYKLNPSSMFLRKAMRYYRLWIYSANLTILLGAIIFLLSTLFVVSDYRFQLIVASSSWPPPSPAKIQASTIMGHQNSSLSDQDNKSTTGVVVGQISGDNLTQQLESASSSDPVQQLEQSFTISPSEPTIILAYLMIVFQLGLLQALGCFGAIQMKERLIQAFWYLILALIVTDVLILVYWLQRYDSMLRSLRDEMTSRLERQYGLQEFLYRNEANDDLASRNSTRFDDFTRKNSESQSNAHVADDAQQTGLQEARLQFDKIFTQIFDRIQSESRCCGVGSSLDYKHTRWREARVALLREQYLRQEQQERDRDPENYVSQEQVISQLDKLLTQLPLVPPSCCRPPSKSNDESIAHKQANVIEQYLDDSQLPQRARVPAWSPSMVVDNLIVGYADNFGSGQKPNAGSATSLQQQRLAEEVDGTTNNKRAEGEQDEPTLADVIDKRWSSGSRYWRHSKPTTAADYSSSAGHQYENDDWTHDEDHDKSRSQADDDDGDDNKKTTRLLAKQMHYGHDALHGGTSSVAAAGDDGREADEDLERPERVARQLQRRAARQDNEDDDDEEGPSAGNSYDAEDEDEEEPDASATSTRNELEEEEEAEKETKDNNNNESGHERRGRQYRAENDELLSSDSRGSPLAATGDLASGGRAGRDSPRISNSRDDNDQWAIETELDKRGRVLARLVELATERRRHQANDSTTTNGPDGMRNWAPLSRPSDDAQLPAELDKLPPKINNELRLGLTRDQFQLIESYLTSDEIGQMTDEQLHGRTRNEQQQQQQQKTSASVQAGKVISRRSILSAPSAEDQDKQQQPALDAEKLAKQRVRVKQLKRLQELVARGSSDQPACLPRSHYDEARIYTRGCQTHIRAWIQSSANTLFVMGFCVLTVLKFCSLILLRLEIREMIHKIKVLKGMATEYNALQDLEPYLPRPSICAQAAELTSTGVTSALGGVSAGGGSPTAQIGGNQLATGLSNSVNAIGQMQQQVGVAGESGGGPLAASCSSPTATASGYMGVPRRIGGSFSEAVAAATAVAHQQKLAEQQQHAQLARHLRHCERASSLANCARAASTKTILGGGCSCAASLGPAGVAGMLVAPQHHQHLHHHQSGLCPCTSSLSMTAHLSHSASQSQATPATGLSLRSDLFPPLGVAMPRRHTAVSVCPAAAAAATAAAHHLMMRRGTFALANPLTFTSTSKGQQQQQAYSQQPQPLSQQPGILKPTSGSSAVLSAAASSANMLQAKSLNYLNQHRHSAHAVPPSHLLFGGSGDGAARGMNLLNPTNRQVRRASNLSPSEMIAAAANDNSRHLEPRDDNNQQQQLVFRRQASGGAQSAVNFSMDIALGGAAATASAAGEQLGESRRSIH